MKTSCIKEVVVTLEEWRDEQPSQFDVRVKEELDDVIRQLKTLPDDEDEKSRKELVEQAFIRLATFIGVATNIWDIIDRFSK